MSDAIETELKLEVLPSKAAGLRTRRLERLGGGAGIHERLASTYFDTPKHALRRHGLTLRVRRAGDRRIQTVKEARAPGAGLFARPEWESEVAGDMPDLAAAVGTPVHALLGDRFPTDLRAVFTTEVDRTTWTVETERSTIEISLDEGRVSADGASRPIAELEMELKRGRPADLFALLHDLGGPESLRIGVTTKSEQGYGLVARGTRTSFKAEPVGLVRGLGSADAFALIVRSCIRHLGLNEPLVVETRSADALHQARVAMRRLRSAFSLFKPLVEDDASAGLRRRLRSVSARLGEARNLDVFVERVLGPDKAGEADPELARIGMELAVDREAAYARVIAAFGSKRFRGLMLDLLVWSEAGSWRTSDDPERRARCDRPIGETAARIVRQRRRRLERDGRHLDRLTPEKRHEVRIAAKKLRYASEFFAGLVEGRRDRRRHAAFLSAIEDLQGSLGDLNDIQTGRDLAARAARAADGTLSEAALRHLRGRNEEREGDLVASAVKGYRAASKAKAYWKGFA